MNTGLDEFYEDTNIFVTGGSGFIGKVLLEKLLRSQSNIKKIYILIRSKKGKSSDERAQKQIFSQPIFEQVKKTQPHFLDKIVVISGDITKPLLGLDEQDKQLLQEEINIVFNCAASTNMAASLKSNVKTNLISVSELLKLCRGMEKLKSVVIVSTAYSNCPRHVIEEKIYDSHLSSDLVLAMCDEIDEETLEKMVPLLLNEHPNTYTLSKSLMESTLKRFNDLPIVLFRPAIVVGSYLEPLPGWVDNLNGPTGLIFGGGMGVIKLGFVNEDTLANWVPVDMCTNALICSAWHGIQSSSIASGDIPVYNYSCDKQKRSFGELIAFMSNLGIKLNQAIWKPGCLYVNNAIHYYILSFLLHTLPALLMDVLLTLAGSKIRLMEIYKTKVNPATKVLSYFATSDWTISEDNTYSMLKSLTEEERNRYFFDANDLDFETWLRNYTLGIKLFIAKDKLEDNHKTERWHKILTAIHYVFLTILVSFFLWIILQILRFF